MVQLPPDLLRTFVSAADTGGFTSAAERVHRTQSAVSMQMKRLETELGKSLFTREGRGVRLTQDGNTLYRFALRLLALHDEALAALREPALVGEVRLGAPEDYAAQYLPGALQRFATVHPRITVNVYCDASPVLQERFARNELDVVITTEARPDGPFCHQQDLIWIVADHGGPLGESPLPLALFHQGCQYRHNTLTALEEAGITHRIAYGSPSLAGVLAAVQAGLAVAPVARGTEAPGCRRATELDGLPPLAPVGIALRVNEQHPSAAARSLHDFINLQMERTAP